MALSYRFLTVAALNDAAYYSETACIFINLQRLVPGGLFKLNLAPPEAPLSRDREGAFDLAGAKYATVFAECCT